MIAESKKSSDKVTTRERILEAALKLFNEKGTRAVTTAEIAEYLGIREGNLWYHFRAKQEIVFELFCRLEAEVDEDLSRAPQKNESLRHFMQHAARAFEYLWEYRFLYRDRFDYQKNPDFSRRVQELTGRGQKNIERILADMRRCGILSIPITEMRRLAVNAWIIHSNWLVYLQARESIEEITERHLKEGFAQLFSLFNPYLSEEGKQEAEKFIDEFALRSIEAESGAQKS